MGISKVQPMRPALDACIDAINGEFDPIIDPYIEMMEEAAENANTAAAAADAAREGLQADVAGTYREIGEVTGTERTICTLANGTVHNTGNAYAISTVEALEVAYGDVVVLDINREPDVGCMYAYNFYKVDSAGTNIGQALSLLLFDEPFANIGRPHNVFPIPSDNYDYIRFSFEQVDETDGAPVQRTDEFNASNLAGLVEVRRYKYDEYIALTSQVKGNVEKAKSGIDNLSSYAVFGNLSLSQGSPTPAKFRAASDHIISFDRDITLIPANGFRFGIHTFVDGSFSSDSGWKSAAYTVPKNTNFKIVIAKDASTEVQNITANVNELVSAVTFDTSLRSYVNNEFNDTISIALPFAKNSGGYVSANNGNVYVNSMTGYTNYINVSVLDGYMYCPIDHVATYQMAFYDEDKVYVSGAAITPVSSIVWTIPIPDNAKYARLSYYLDVADEFYIKGKAVNINAYECIKLNSKKLGIVGDSISTFSGYIPSGYATFYPRNTVTSVDKTWWKQLLDQTGMELCVNASWSGSTISGDTTRTDGYVGCSDARVAALTDANGNKPDIIICWIGINDFGKSNGITCGNYDGTTAPSTATTINAITEAYGVLLKKLQTAYPDAQIFVCRILPEQFASEMAASYANGFPNINPSDNISLPQLNDSIEKIANAFGCGIIPMDKCGATFFNINSYTGDGLHPNALLTPKMCEVAKQTLLQIVK